jgi:hypothetical protein
MEFQKMILIPLEKYNQLQKKNQTICTVPIISDIKKEHLILPEHLCAVPPVSDIKNEQVILPDTESINAKVNEGETECVIKVKDKNNKKVQQKNKTEKLDKKKVYVKRLKNPKDIKQVSRIQDSIKGSWIKL